MQSRKLITILSLTTGLILTASCLNPESITAQDNLQTNSLKTEGLVTVLCNCGKRKTSWQGKNKTLAEQGARRNCELMQLSLSQCQVIK